MPKIVLITGATSGIGEASAIKFAQNGCDIIITGRRAERLEELERRLSQYHVRILSLCFDVANENEVKDKIEKSFNFYNSTLYDSNIFCTR